MVEVINPNLVFSCDKMMTQADEFCRWMLKEKSLSKQADDPLIVLKMRFAKGEISKDEYLEMKKVLEG